MRVFAALSIMALASANPAKPMERLMQTTNGNNGGVLGNLINAGSQLLPAAKPNKEVQMILDAAENGVDVVNMFNGLLNGDAFKVITDNVEIQHRIMESLPALAAFKGFDKLSAGKRNLAEGEAKNFFAEGMKSVMNVLSDAVSKKNTDPVTSVKTLAELAKADPQLFAKAQAGDKNAFDEINRRYTKQAFPDLNENVMDILKKSAVSPSKLLEMEGLGPIMETIISQDPVLEQVIKNPQTPEQLIKKATGKSI